MKPYKEEASIEPKGKYTRFLASTIIGNPPRSKERKVQKIAKDMKVIPDPMDDRKFQE